MGGDYQGLGIIRSLGRHGIPSVVIDDEKNIGRYSRYTRHVISVPSLRKPGEATGAALTAANTYGLEGWVLFPTRDEIVADFSRDRALLRNRFRVPTPAWDSVKFAWDKRNTHCLLKRLNIPGPRSFSPTTVEELDQIDFDPPYVLKPAIKEHFFYTTKAKAWCANSREELREFWERATCIAPPGEILVQEFIPGDGRQQFSYCAFFKDGKALASMVAQRRRQHPAVFGRASTFVVTVDNPLLESYGAAFLKAIDYYGLAEIEFKFDTRENQYKLHDVNLRTWGYHSVGYRAGVDFPYLVFQDQLGGEGEPRRAVAGVKWLRSVTDFPASFLDITQGRLGIGEYFSSFSGPLTEAVMDWRDPLPAAAELCLLPYLIYKRGF
jgi:D-aspartate ligase